MLLHCCSTTTTAATATTLANHNKYNNKVSAQQIARAGQADTQADRQDCGRHQVTAEVLEVLIKCGRRQECEQAQSVMGSVSQGRGKGKGRVAIGADNQIDMSCRRCRATRAAASGAGVKDLIYTRRKVHLT